MEQTFTNDIEELLDKIRTNAIILADIHRANYFSVKQKLQYFKLPTIIISTINSIIAVSLQAYIGQDYTSMVNCLLSMVASIIVSIEMYYGLSRSLDEEIALSKEYYLLSVNIYKMLQLDRSNRNVDGRAYLDEMCSMYMKLYENSQLHNKKVKDALTPLPVVQETRDRLPTTPSLSSLSVEKGFRVGDILCEVETSSNGSGVNINKV